MNLKFDYFQAVCISNKNIIFLFCLLINYIIDYSQNLAIYLKKLNHY